MYETGTLAPVAMAHRPAPPSKPRTRLRRRPPPSGLPGDNVYEQYDEAIDGIDGSDDGRARSQTSSAYTVSKQFTIREIIYYFMQETTV